MKAFSTLSEAKQETQLRASAGNDDQDQSDNGSTAALSILAGVGTALILVTVVIALVTIRFQSCRHRLERRRDEHSTWRTDSLGADSSNEMVASTTASDRDLIQPSPGITHFYTKVF